MERTCFLLAFVILCGVAPLAGAAPHPRVVYLLDGHQVLDHEFPRYPQRAVEQRWQGTGILRLHVRSDGRVSRATFVTSTGYETLDLAARETFSRWRFQPEKSPFTADVPFSFRLGDKRGTRAIARPVPPPKKA